MADGPKLPEPVKFNLQWEDFGPEPPQFANQFALSAGGNGEFYLTVGYVTPPLLVGDTPEERLRKAQQAGDTLAVRPIARYAVTPETIRALGSLVDRALEVMKKMGEEGAAE